MGRELRGKSAVITGGGGGIGRGMALAFADAGMSVVLADVDLAAGERVRAEVEARGVGALFVPTDVTDRDALEALAERAYGEHGEVHVLCNNAGCMTFEPLHRLRDSDWRWVLEVNLFGVIHGIQAFLPRMQAQAGWAHMVNTASIAGLTAAPRLAPYSASKYAVVAISETIRAERSRHGIGCSVLCPGSVNTQIARSERNRPPGYEAPTSADMTALAGLLAQALDPLEVGRIVRQAVIDDEFWVQTDPAARVRSEERLQEILASFDRAAARVASQGS